MIGVKVIEPKFLSYYRGTLFPLLPPPFESRCVYVMEIFTNSNIAIYPKKSQSRFSACATTCRISVWPRWGVFEIPEFQSSLGILRGYPGNLCPYCCKFKVDT